MTELVRVAVLVSGGGSNLEAILQAQEADQLPGIKVVCVLSNKEGVLALERSRNYGIQTAVVNNITFSSEDDFQRAVLSELEAARADVICLAGYLKKVGPDIVRRFRGRILNIHPALLPKYGGPGMFGPKVHKAVLAAGDKESGCTVHVVDDDYDHGPILAQVKVPVLAGDTPETLAARVLEQEHKLYPKTLWEFCRKMFPGVIPAKAGIQSDGSPFSRG